MIRALQPGDDVLYPEFHSHVSGSDRRLRFFSAAPLSERQIFRLTRYDPREAVVRAAVGIDCGELYGVGRLHRIQGRQGEFAVMVRSDLKGQGLGGLLLRQVIERAPSIGVTEVVGLVLPENTGMRALAEELGFAIAPDPEESGLLRASLDLEPPDHRRAA
ncbi:GNAT family N-acetyltransferase [Enterovirga rhinocerotis]|uniref:GNAT family N-acetyltransferase n=1 Tax=Enterovirga rhinocerotis TaxID=1339210 RepID=UPI001414CD9A|nr:GNAT family N-acetyltransferase [Enterovirga rhinocerotis]